MRIFILMMLFFAAFTTFANQTKNDKLTVLLDWYLNPDHAPLYTAQKKGFFAKYHLNVKLIGPSDPTDPPKYVAAKKADLALTYQPQFMEQVDQGLPLQCVGVLVNHPLNALVTLKKSNIQTIQDLKGKKVGTSIGGVSSVSLRSMLKTVGLTLNDVTLVNVRYNLTQSLLSERVDAVTGVMRNFEIPEIELLGYQVKAFYPEDYHVPFYNELIYIHHINNNDSDKIKRFLKAVTEATLYLRQHPKEVWQLFIKDYPELNNQVNYAAWIKTLPYFAANPDQLDLRAWQQFAIFMQQNGLINKVLPLDQTVKLQG